MKKKCTKCHAVKDEIEFGWRSIKHKKRLAYCKVCRNIMSIAWRQKNPVKYKRQTRRNLLKKYSGLTVKQYGAVLVIQDGVCAICKKPETAMRRGKLVLLAVDHDRITKKVRGLLCGRCNRGLGEFKHDPVRLYKAAAYLERYR